MKSEGVSHSVVSNSLQPQELYIAHQTPLSMDFSRLRILEWVAISFSKGSSQGFPRTHGSNPALQADSLPSEPPGKPFKRVKMPIRKGRLAPARQVEKS